MRTPKAFELELCALLSPLLTLPVVGVVDDSCKVHDCMGSFDLSPLRASTDYTFSHNHQNFTLNVCRGVVSELWNSKIENTETVGAFVRGPHGDLSIGETNSTLHVRNGHPMLYLLNGSPCPQSESTFSSTVISFICDKAVEVDTPHLIAELPEEGENACSYFLEWRTKHACPILDSRSGWKALLTVVVIALSLLIALLALLLFQRRVASRRRAANGGFDYTNDSPHSRPWYTPSGASERLHDFGRLVTGQDPWGDTPDSGMNGHGNGNANGNVNGAAGGGGGGGSRRWAPKFGGLRLFGGGGARKGFGGRGGFSRLPQSLEEEAMMRNGGDERFSLSDDENEREADITSGGGVPPAVNEERAAWGAARLRGMDGNGVIRL